jgi:hypothetical protein
MSVRNIVRLFDKKVFETTTTGYAYLQQKRLELHFDNTIKDTSGNNIAGEWRNGDGAFVMDGFSGEAAHFDGTDSGSYIQMKHHDSLGDLKQMTISVRARRNTANSTGRIFLKSGQFELAIRDSDVLAFVTFTNYVDDKLVYERVNLSGSVAGIDNTDWHHYVIIYDGRSVSLYVDNIENLIKSVEINKLPGKVRNNTQQRLYIGKLPWGDQLTFDGDIDEFVIYDHVLPQW